MVDSCGGCKLSFICIHCCLGINSTCTTIVRTINATATCDDRISLLALARDELTERTVATRDDGNTINGEMQQLVAFLCFSYRRMMNALEYCWLIDAYKAELVCRYSHIHIGRKSRRRMISKSTQNNLAFIPPSVQHLLDMIYPLLGVYINLV